MHISQMLSPEAISIDLAGANIDEILKELARLVQVCSAKLDQAHIHERLSRRERMLSTAMGCGIAFPHCTSDQVSAPCFALGISRAGVEADAPDNKPVHVFFAVVSPEKDPNSHLDALAAASRLFVNGRVRNHLMSAATAEDVIAAIELAEAKNPVEG